MHYVYIVVINGKCQVFSTYDVAWEWKTREVMKLWKKDIIVTVSMVRRKVRESI